MLYPLNRRIETNKYDKNDIINMSSSTLPKEELRLFSMRIALPSRNERLRTLSEKEASQTTNILTDLQYTHLSALYIKLIEVSRNIIISNKHLSESIISGSGMENVRKWWIDMLPIFELQSFEISNKINEISYETLASDDIKKLTTTVMEFIMYVDTQHPKKSWFIFTKLCKLFSGKEFCNIINIISKIGYVKAVSAFDIAETPSRLSVSERIAWKFNRMLTEYELAHCV